MIQIKNMSGEVIKNLRHTDLRHTDLQDANLSGADLRHTDLRDTNLRDANLRGANLRGAEIENNAIIQNIPIQIDCTRYHIFIYDNHMKIGCEFHSFDEWFTFPDRKIIKMDGKGALKWWNNWRLPLMVICEDGK